ncbi:MAG: thiamine-phosphate kinase [Candidatus Edwardsbacteria bacterium]
MQLHKLGEFGLIERIRKKFKKARSSKRILVGIGDDTAIISPHIDKLVLLTIDTMVEGLHFDLSYMTFADIGWKLMASNLSDIAAMGGIPVCALISLAVPSSYEVKWIDELYKGIEKISRRFNVSLVGGDTVSSSLLVVSLSLYGEIDRKKFSLRSGAKVGDLIFVTGNLGGSEAGRLVLKHNLPLGGEVLAEVKSKHLHPIPRIDKAKMLLKNVRIHSMIDISDGLASEINHIAEESKVGALIYEDKIPISKSTQKVAEKLGDKAINYALYGGEDYELLFTLSQGEQKKVKNLTNRIPIGEIIERKKGVLLIDRNGYKHRLKAKGYEHFKNTISAIKRTRTAMS